MTVTAMSVVQLFWNRRADADMDAADRIAWHVQQAHTSRRTTAENRTVWMWSLRVKQARASREVTRWRGSHLRPSRVPADPGSVVALALR